MSEVNNGHTLVPTGKSGDASMMCGVCLQRGVWLNIRCPGQCAQPQPEIEVARQLAAKDATIAALEAKLADRDQRIACLELVNAQLENEFAEQIENGKAFIAGVTQMLNLSSAALFTPAPPTDSR